MLLLPLAGGPVAAVGYAGSRLVFARQVKDHLLDPELDFPGGEHLSDLDALGPEAPADLDLPGQFPVHLVSHAIFLAAELHPYHSDRRKHCKDYRRSGHNRNSGYLVPLTRIATERRATPLPNRTERIGASAGGAGMTSFWPARIVAMSGILSLLAS